LPNPLLVTFVVVVVAVPFTCVVVVCVLAKYSGMPAKMPKCLLKSYPAFESSLKILLSEFSVP
jgi:hypothetical protein